MWEEDVNVVAISCGSNGQPDEEGKMWNLTKGNKPTKIQSNGVYSKILSVFRGWSRSPKEMVEHGGNEWKVKIDNGMKKEAGIKKNYWK